MPFSFLIYPLAALHSLRYVLRVAHARTSGSFCVALVIGGRVHCRTTGGVACYFPDGAGASRAVGFGSGFGNGSVALGWDR